MGASNRVEELRDLGRRIAAELRSDPDMLQQVAVARVGLHIRSYWRYLEKEGEEYEAFQAEVLPAVYELAEHARRKAEADIGSSPAGSGAWANWHKWMLEKRFRTIFGDLAQAPAKVELTGKDGEALFKQAETMSLADLRAEIVSLAREVGAAPELQLPNGEPEDTEDD